MVYSTHSRVRASSLIAIALLSACGPAVGPHAPITPQEGVPVVAPAAEAAKPLPSGDTSAVPAPNSLVVTGHLRSASELESQLGVGIASLFGGASGQANEAFDANQPFDFAVTASGKGRGLRAAWAMSFPIKNNAVTRTALEQHASVTERDGILYLEDKQADESKTRCAVASAFGPATHRIICASDGPSLELMAPYLARTLTREEVKDLVSIHFDVRPLHETVRTMRALADVLVEDRLGRKERELVGPMIGHLLDACTDYVGDLSVADLAIDPGQTDVTASLTFHYDSSKSPLTKSILARADRNHAPADAFLHLPKDTKFAVSHNGVPKESQEMLRAYKDALKNAADQVPDGGKLAKEKEQAIKMVTDLIDQLLADAPGALGVGFEGSLRGLRSDRKTLWIALEQDAPVSRWIAIVKQMPTRGKDLVKFGPASASRRLPAGSYTADIAVPRGPGYSLALVPLSKGRTLVAFAGSETALKHVVDSVASKEVGLGAVATIDALKAQPSNSFIAVRASVFEVPGAGEDDFVTVASTATSSGGGGTGTIKWWAPKPLISTVLGLLKHMGGSAGKRHGEPKLGPDEPDN